MEVYIQPGASKTELAGLHGGCVKIRIAAPPVDNAANRALVEFVKRVSEISRGKAYFTNTMTLGQFILMDFLRKKTRKVS